MSRYDYHDQGMYVVSVDVEGREPRLGQTVGTEDEARVDLSAAGIVAKRTAAELKILFPQVSVFMCVVMIFFALSC